MPLKDTQKRNEYQKQLMAKKRTAKKEEEARRQAEEEARRQEDEARRVKKREDTRLRVQACRKRKREANEAATVAAASASNEAATVAAAAARTQAFVAEQPFVDDFASEKPAGSMRFATTNSDSSPDASNGVASKQPPPPPFQTPAASKCNPIVARALTTLPKKYREEARTAQKEIRMAQKKAREEKIQRKLELLTEKKRRHEDRGAMLRKQQEEMTSSRKLVEQHCEEDKEIVRETEEFHAELDAADEEAISDLATDFMLDYGDEHHVASPMVASPPAAAAQTNPPGTATKMASPMVASPPAAAAQTNPPGTATKMASPIAKGWTACLNEARSFLFADFKTPHSTQSEEYSSPNCGPAAGATKKGPPTTQSNAFSSPPNHSPTQYNRPPESTTKKLPPPTPGTRCNLVDYPFDGKGGVFSEKGRLGNGKGAFGTVYQAENTYDGQQYAIKVVFGKQAWQEATSLATLSNKGCPYIVGYYGFWKSNDLVYIQTELCRGLMEVGTVQTAMQNPKKLLRDMLEALKFIHGKSWCHLDIKPDNIFVSINGDTYKLGDFGHAKPVKSKDFEAGDEKYMAMELFDPKNCTDLSKADIFSLGLTMYGLVLGQHDELPVNGKDWHALRNGLAPGRLDSKALHFIVVDSMMHSNYQKRPSAAELLKQVDQLAHELEDLNISPSKSPPIIQKRPLAVDSLKQPDELAHESENRSSTGNIPSRKSPLIDQKRPSAVESLKQSGESAHNSTNPFRLSTANIPFSNIIGIGMKGLFNRSNFVISKFLEDQTLAEIAIRQDDGTNIQMEVSTAVLNFPVGTKVRYNGDPFVVSKQTKKMVELNGGKKVMPSSLQLDN